MYKTAYADRNLLYFYKMSVNAESFSPERPVLRSYCRCVDEPLRDIQINITILVPVLVPVPVSRIFFGKWLPKSKLACLHNIYIKQFWLVGWDTFSSQAIPIDFHLIFITFYLKSGKFNDNWNHTCYSVSFQSIIDSVLLLRKGHNLQSGQPFKSIEIYFKKQKKNLQKCFKIQKSV